MANKKNKKKAPVPQKTNNAPAPAEKSFSAKKIIIAAVAVLLVAAVAVTCFVKRDSIAALFDDSTKTTSPVNPVITTVPAFDGDEDPIDVTTIDGFDKVPEDIQALLVAQDNKIPNEFKKVIVGAYKDSAAAVGKQGNAYAFGTTEISVPEAVMYYYDEYCTSFAATYNQAGSDPKDIAKTSLMDLYTRPEDQKNKDGVPWSEVLSENSIDRIENSYILFREALTTGCTISAREAQEVYFSYSRVCDYADSKRITPDQMCEDTYSKGLTYNMFAFREIRDAYAAAYREAEKAKFVAAVDVAAAEKEYSEKSKYYDCVDIRLYTITKGDKSLADLNGELSRNIQSEADFIEYATVNGEDGNPNFDPDANTDFFMRNYDFFKEYYGDGIAEWCFEPDRKSGDVAVVEGPIFYCLLYCNRPAYKTYSAQVYHCFFPYNEYNTTASSQMEYDDTKALAESAYNDWVKNGATPEAFASLANFYPSSPIADQNGLVEKYVAGARFAFVDNWIYDSTRKEGDHTLIETDSGFEILYFSKINSDDPDWFRVYCDNNFEISFSKNYAELCKDKKNEKTVPVGSLSRVVIAARKSIDNYIEIMSEGFAEE